MRIFTYCRVSTEDQTIAPQEKELALWAQAGRHEIVGAFEDVMSGTKDSRPGIDAMFAALELQQLDAIVCVKLDRLARSVSNFAKIDARLEKLGVALICTSQGIDTTTTNPCGNLMRNILSAFAAFERELISERTKAGLANARANGKHLGKTSPNLVDEPMRSKIIAKFIAKGCKGYRKLANNLGGIGLHTAHRYVQKELSRIKSLKKQQPLEIT